FQAEDGIRDFHVTGVQTCALPICSGARPVAFVVAMFVHMAHQVFILLHAGSGDDHQASTMWMECVISAVRPNMADAEQYFSCERSEERRVGKECSCRWLACAA